MTSENCFLWCSAKNKLKLTTNFMNKLNAVISIVALVVLTSCSKKDAGATNSSQATMNVQEAKSAVKEVPYKSEIERGLTLQFDYVSFPHGEIKVELGENNGDSVRLKQFQILYNGKLITRYTGETAQYINSLIEVQKTGVITIQNSAGAPATSVYTNKNELMIEKAYKVEWTSKALGLRDEKYSTADVLCIQLGACKVRTVVKDIEYHNPNLSQSDDFRLVVGTYEIKPNDFGKSQGVVDNVFKFRAVIKLNPFNQTYSFVVGDYGKIDADDWQTQNVPQ